MKTIYLLSGLGKKKEKRHKAKCLIIKNGKPDSVQFL